MSHSGIPMTTRQRAELLALPDSEATVVRLYGLDASDLVTVATVRTPATWLINEFVLWREGFKSDEDDQETIDNSRFDEDNSPIGIVGPPERTRRSAKLGAERCRPTMRQPSENWHTCYGSGRAGLMESSTSSGRRPRNRSRVIARLGKKRPDRTAS